MKKITQHISNNAIQRVSHFHDTAYSIIDLTALDNFNFYRCIKYERNFFKICSKGWYVCKYNVSWNKRCRTSSFLLSFVVLIKAETLRDVAARISFLWNWCFYHKIEIYLY